jgi:hypothetical protein
MTAGKAVAAELPEVQWHWSGYNAPGPEMQTFVWSIEDIVAAHPDLYLEHCAIMAVALMSRHSRSPCEFLVECEGFCPAKLEEEGPFLLHVNWSEETALTAMRIWLTEQAKPILERAAVALAALIFAHLVPDGHMRVTEQGQRADYWLPRLRCALEISGTAQRREVRRRHREKIAQMLANPWHWNGYVFVACFGAAPRLIRWSYHAQKEQEDAAL